MSITFRGNVTSFETTVRDEPCLCAQMADGFGPMMRGEDSEVIRASLKADADPNCSCCKGSGVESVRTTDIPELNWANDNALRFLAVLGVEPNYYGELAIADARRGLMKARARQDLTPFERAAETVYGAPRANDDGTVELRPIRVMGASLTAENLKERIERFASFVEASVARGATLIAWG